MRALKIAAVVVALLFIFTIFQNSYSTAMAQAKEEENETESALPEAKNGEQSSISEPVSSVPGPPVPASASDPTLASPATPTSDPAATLAPASVPVSIPEAFEERSITEPREQFAITEALVMFFAFIILLILFILMLPVLIILIILTIIFFLTPIPYVLIFLFIFFIMFLPVILASFADLSSYEIPASIQTILNDIGSKGTVTEILFAYFKNLWSIVLNLPEIARLTGNLTTEDYAYLIKSLGSFFLSWPSNLRALPDKILRNLFPTINALPGWLRQSPVLLQVFPLLPLPIGPQAVKSYPTVFRLFLSLAENSIAILLGMIALPLSALISLFKGLPGSLRTVFYHFIDFALTPIIFPMRVLPLLGTFVVLLVLWILGFVLAVPFSLFLPIALVLIVLAIFVGGINTDAIREAIDNLPENVDKVDEVIIRIAGLLSKANTIEISSLLSDLTGVEWLIATQNLPDTLPEAVQEVGSAIPAIINSGPEIVRTLIDSGSNLVIVFVYDVLGTFTILIKDIFAIIWAMPELAILIPQLLEILSVITIHLPALIRGFIPAAVDAVEKTTVSLPELFPSIVLSTMGLNVIVLQFARAIWDMFLDIVEMIRKFLWSLILFLPASVFDFEEFVTPWFGPRLLSVIGLVCGAIPAMIIGGLSAIFALIITVVITVLMLIYIPLMIVLAIFMFVLAVLEVIVFLVPQVADLITAIESTIASIETLTEIRLPIIFFVFIIIVLFPLIGLVVALLILAIIYFSFYVFQIMFGLMLMACSGVFDTIVFVPLMSLCKPVPIASKLLGAMRTLTSFYAFCIPPNVIEIITQLIPLSVNCLASCPAIIFMPISLLQTFISTSSKAVEAIPSVPEYLGRLIDRIIFSFVAEILAICSFVIDLVVALVLIVFACTTGLIFQCLTLDILTNAPEIAILVLALIFVTFAWIIDLVGVLCLRTPDMINEYTHSILKSMAMMPVLSAIIPDMAAAPAAMQPEVVSEGLSKILIIIILFPLAAVGAFVALVYNLSKSLFMWIYEVFPSIFALPFNLIRRVLDFINSIFSGIGSAIEGAAESVESQLIPY